MIVWSFLELIEKKASYVMAVEWARDMNLKRMIISTYFFVSLLIIIHNIYSLSLLISLMIHIIIIILIQRWIPQWSNLNKLIRFWYTYFAWFHYLCYWFEFLLLFIIFFITSTSLIGFIQCLLLAWLEFTYHFKLFPVNYWSFMNDFSC